jgi:hypothetical protein
VMGDGDDVAAKRRGRAAFHTCVVRGLWWPRSGCSMCADRVAGGSLVLRVVRESGQSVVVGRVESDALLRRAVVPPYEALLYVIALHQVLFGNWLRLRRTECQWCIRSDRANKDRTIIYCASSRSSDSH